MLWLAVGEESRVNDPNTRIAEVLEQVPELEPKQNIECNGNTTKRIIFSWTPSTLNRTQGPYWYPVAVILNT